jgi:large subunit ribosomal protein L25
MTVQLTIQKRAKVLDENAKSTSIAGVVYGRKFPSTPIVVDRKEFEKIYKEAGESTIINLTGLDTPVEALIKDIDFSALRGQVSHVDFYAIEKGKEVTAHVPLHFIGESEATKMGAVVDKVMHEVTVKATAANLPTHLDVDLGLLKVAEDKIHVSDIKTGKGVKIESDPSEVVAKVELIKEEVVAPLESEVTEVTESVSE